MVHFFKKIFKKQTNKEESLAMRGVMGIHQSHLNVETMTTHLCIRFQGTGRKRSYSSDGEVPGAMDCG